MRSTLADRFWVKVAPAPALSCWEWTACRNKYGYGQIAIPGGMSGAHRVAWILLRGAIPDGLTIDHLCYTPWCVNPWHMDLVPRGENTRRARTDPTRWRSHCLRGHEFTEGNTNVLARGRRSCRKCEAIRSKKWRDKQLA